jgi:predicted anti-sigma-YlaC factor YlaD
MKIECRQVLKIVCEEYNFNDENDSMNLKIKQHLEVCEDCRNYVNSLQKIIISYKNYEVKVEEDCSLRLLKNLGLI